MILSGAFLLPVMGTARHRRDTAAQATVPAPCDLLKINRNESVGMIQEKRNCQKSDQIKTKGVVLGPDDEVLNVPDSVTIPGEVAERVLVEEKTMLRAWREHLKLTQAQVAERMGITTAAYSQMERGEDKLRIDTLKRIAKAMGVPDWRKLVE